jgi:hypothetical protein
MARATGLEPAASGVTGRQDFRRFKEFGDFLPAQTGVNEQKVSDDILT